MNITISARGKSLDSDVDPRFGRSRGFILFDTQTGNTKHLDNLSQRELAQGTGIKTAQMIAESGTDVLITGQLGPKASRVLSKSQIKIYACTSGTVKQAIQALQENRLKELKEGGSGPGKMGGRGMGGEGRGRRGRSHHPGEVR